MLFIGFCSGILLEDDILEINNEKKFVFQVLGVDGDLSINAYNGYITYSFVCKYLESNFRFYIVFFNGKRDGGPYLVWLDGVCEKKKWESSERDLYSDVNNLKNIFNLNGIYPYKEHEDLNFFYKINGVLIRLIASLKSMSVVIHVEC
jgi:hypothetical protein